MSRTVGGRVRIGMAAASCCGMVACGVPCEEDRPDVGWYFLTPEYRLQLEASDVDSEFTVHIPVVDAPGLTDPTSGVAILYERTADGRFLRHIYDWGDNVPPWSSDELPSCALPTSDAVAPGTEAGERPVELEVESSR